MPDTGAPAGPQREGTARWPAFLVYGRKLLRREVNGDVFRCPNVIPLGAGDTIPTTVCDGFLYSALDKYVTRKLTVSRR